MRNYLTFDGLDSRDYGVYISGQGTFSAPAKDYTMLSVPGRDGDLIGPERRLQNLDVVYPVFIYDSFAAKVSDFRNMLLSRDGYVELRDSYHPGEFRLAVYRGPFTPDVTRLNNAGSFDLTFHCKPQRYLDSGQIWLDAPSSVTNPTQFAARPLIRIPAQASSYSGTITVGAVTVMLTDMPANVIVYVDCEMQDVYGAGGQNFNQSTQLTGYDFPVLRPGATGLSWTVPTLSVMGRWFVV